jgi:4-amino-4-deoxy-L-arabinose transferase-like glycosyltransferase
MFQQLDTNQKYQVQTEASQAADHRDGVWLIALWTLLTAYNLFKPYHIDDTAHLEIARWISTHPLHPMRGLLNWGGSDEPIYYLNQPHLYFYLLALWGSLFGYSEAAMHTPQSFAALACILLFHRLARLLVEPIALWATAILILGPAFVVEQNLMVDVPLLATWLAFFNPLICQIASPHQHRRYALAALACSAALLIKYSSLVLVVILCLSLVLERRWKQSWTALIPLAAIAAWSLFNIFDYNGVHIVGRSHVGTRAHLWLLKERIGAWVLALGALTPLGLIGAVQSRWELLRVEKAIYGTTFLGFMAVILSVAWNVLSDWQSDKLLRMVFFANGTLICLTLVPAALRVASSRLWRPEVVSAFGATIYLLLWILGTTAFYVVFAPFIAARHVLLILPAITLLLVSRWDRSLTWRSRFFGLALTVIVSIGLCLSDWRFAEFYKLEATKLRHSLSTAGTIWASGHLGWQWYATQAGFREVDVQSSELRPGDYFVVADDIDHQPLKMSPPMRLVRNDTQDGSFLNLFCTRRFYESDFWAAPWSLSRACLNHITVYQIEGSK